MSCKVSILRGQYRNMMKRKRAPGVYCMAGALILSAAHAHASAPCRAGHAVDLVVALDPPEAGAQQQLEQRLAAELRARDLDVCTPAAGGPSVAQVRVAAPLPQLSPTWVTVRTAGGSALERNLDVSGLPAEARPSAIASATDELLSASLLSSGMQAAPSPAPQSAASTPPAGSADRTTSETPPADAAWRLPRLELGLGGGGALFAGDARAVRGELLARWRPLSRLSSTLRLGLDRRPRTETPWRLLGNEFTVVDRASSWHAGLDVGFELIEPAQGFGIAAVAGLGLARVRITEDLQVAALDGTPMQATNSSWEVATNVGVEASYRARGWGVELALSALVPLTSRERSEQTGAGDLMEQSGQYQAWVISSSVTVPPGAGFGEQLGGQLDLRLWLALDP